MLSFFSEKKQSGAGEDSAIDISKYEDPLDSKTGQTPTRRWKRQSVQKEGIEEESVIDDEQLRAKLLPIFQEFDTDGSGMISTDELSTMSAKLNLNLTLEQMDAILLDADPDGSGEIDFDEFTGALKRQIGEGDGPLVKMLSAGTGGFGWFNPISWFSLFAEPPAPAPPYRPEDDDTVFPTPTWAPFVRSSSAAKAAKPAGPPSERLRRGMPPSPVMQEEGPTGGSSQTARTAAIMASARSSALGTARSSTARSGQASQRGLSSVRSTSSRLSKAKPTSMKVTKAIVLEENRDLGDEMRQDSVKWGDFHARATRFFLREQKERIEGAHTQEGAANRAVSEIKVAKREAAQKLKGALKSKYAEGLEEKRQHAEIGRQNAAEQKEAALAVVEERAQQKEAQALYWQMSGTEARHKRRTQHAEVVNRVTEEAQEKAERVRYETRPTVRQEGRVLFQEQRDAAYLKGKEEAEARKIQIEEQKRQHLERQAIKKAEIDEQKLAAAAALEQLVESRRLDALAVKASVERAESRKKTLAEETEQQKRELHDDVLTADKSESMIFGWWLSEK